VSDHAEWSPSAGLVVLAWAFGLAAAGWCAALWTGLSGAGGPDPAGGLVAGGATIGLLTFALFGTRARPRLRVDADGVTIGGLLRPRHHPWPFVRRVRVLPVRRFGRRSSLLEIDTEDASGHERLYVLGRLDLAADPEDVLPALVRLRR